jgi:putative transposase
MFRFLRLFVGLLVRIFRSRRDLILENLALRLQLGVFKTRHRKPKLVLPDKLFWVLVRRFWSNWKRVLASRAYAGNGGALAPCGISLYWSWLSRPKTRVGRKRIVAENATWGAPRIQGELQTLGFEISERTVSRWIRRAPRNPEPAKRWLNFLRNYRELIAAMDFFTVRHLRLACCTASS